MKKMYMVRIGCVSVKEFKSVLYDIIENSAKNYPNNIALCDNANELTYSQLRNNILYCANRLSQLGVVEGDKVLLVAPNCNEFVISFFAVNYIGAVLVLGDPKWNDELAVIFSENKIKVIITKEKTLPKLQAQWKKHHENKIFANEVLSILISERQFFYNECAYVGKLTEVVSIKAKKTEQDIALILYTSGSLQRPKAVVNSNYNMINALKNALASVPMFQTDRLVGVIPFYHSYPIGSCMLPGLASGAEIILLDMFNPRKLLCIITEKKVTCIHGVPFIFEQMINYMKKTYDFDSVRLSISGGAPLPLNVAKKYYERTGKIIHQEYGSSETGTVFMNHSDSVEINALSPGKPMKYVEARIYKPDKNGIGHIQVRTKGKAIGYLEQEPFSVGWYDMGDLGKWDTNGNLVICGRVKRIINVSGLKVSPEEIENVLINHPLIEDCIIQSETHDNWGEIVVAYIVRKDEKLTKEKLSLWCSGKMAMYKIPKKIYWVDKVGTKSIGKKNMSVDNLQIKE